MLKYLMTKRALSKRGAISYLKSIFIGTIANLLRVIPAVIIFLFISDLIEKRPFDYWLYGGLIGGFFIVLAIVLWVQYNWNYFTTYNESAVRRLTLAEQIRKLPLSFFGKKDLTDLTTTMMTDATVLEQAFSHFYPYLWSALISTSILSVIIMIANWKIGLAIIWVVPLAFFVVFATRRIQQRFTRATREATLAVEDNVQECLESLRDIKASNYEEQYLATLNEKIDLVTKRKWIGELGVSAFVTSSMMILRVGLGTTVIAGAGLLMAGELPLIYLFGFLFAAAKLYDAMTGALVNLAAIIFAENSVNRMNTLHNTPIQTGTESFSPANFDIEFKDVDFSYRKESQVLRGVSFTAKQGEITALIGPSGGGKSTVAKLAARFWDVDAGTVTLGGTDIKTVDPETLLKSYSIVFQDVTLFNNSVLENIRIGRKDASDEAVLAAARAAQCDEFVNKLPQGYATNIGENGSKLSAGERQRISIARALLKDAPVVLLDEATSNLDVGNETQIQAAMSTLVKNKTVIIIAHRMRTIAGVDKIVVIQDGKIAETGAPAQLAQKQGVYRRMLAIQAESSNWSL